MAAILKRPSYDKGCQDDRQTEKKIDGLEFWVQNLQFQRLSFGESFNAKP